MQTTNLPTGKLTYTLTNDYLFHIVFQKNKTILRGLIRSLLNLRDNEIVDITLENPIQPGDRINDKTFQGTNLGGHTYAGIKLQGY